MGLPLPSFTAYERMVRDAPRHELPGGAVWSMVDLLPDIDAPARARGAFTDFVNVGITGQAPVGNGWGNFGSAKNSLVITADKAATKVSSAGATTSVGTVPAASASYPCSRMVSHRQKLLLAPRGQAAGSPLYVWDGTANVSVATGSPAAPLDVAVYKDFSVAVGDDSGTNPTTVFFSNAGDPTTWQTGVSYINTKDNLVAVAALRDVIILFGKTSIQRILGSIPPGNGPSDMRLDYLTPSYQGILDSRSIVAYQSGVIFADDQAVWFTEGVSLKNLTEKGGIQQYWRKLIEHDGAAYAVAWLHRGYYFITLWKIAGGTPIDTLVCDLDRNAWYRMSNMDFLGGAAGGVFSGVDDTALAYQHSDGSVRLATISSIFGTDVSGQDPNGVWIQPTIETPYMRGWMRLHRKWIPSAGLQSWRNVYLNYDLAGGGALSFKYSLTPETDATGTTTYSPLPNWTGSLGSTTGKVRRRIPLQLPSTGIAFQIQVQNSGAAWTSFRMYEMEFEFYPRETSRV